MPTEQFANNAGTTLTAAVVTSPAAGTSETWTVASSGSPLPGAQYRLLVDDGSGEIVLVTAIVDGTHLTVTRGVEGSPISTHASGASLKLVVTNGSLGTFVKTDPGSFGRNIVQSQGDFVPLTVRGNAGQTANLFEVQDSAGTKMMAMELVSGAPRMRVGANVTGRQGTIVLDGPPSTYKWIEFHDQGIKRWGIDHDSTNNWGVNRYDAAGAFAETSIVGVVGGGLQFCPVSGGPVRIGVKGATDDTSFPNSNIYFYLDEAGNNLKVRAKYAAGTLKTGTIALV